MEYDLSVMTALDMPAHASIPLPTGSHSGFLPYNTHHPDPGGKGSFFLSLDKNHLNDIKSTLARIFPFVDAVKPFSFFTAMATSGTAYDMPFQKTLLTFIEEAHSQGYYYVVFSLPSSSDIPFKYAFEEAGYKVFSYTPPYGSSTLFLVPLTTIHFNEIYTHNGTRYFFTKKPQLLETYYALRQKVYTETWRLEHYSGIEDSYDPKSDIILIEKEQKIIGGLRVLLHFPCDDFLLPLETEDFKLATLLPHLGLDKAAYAEVGRTFIEPRHMNGKDIELAIALSIHRVYIHKAKYLFFISPLPAARRFKVFLKTLKLNYETVNHLPIPKLDCYENLPMQLTYIDLSTQGLLLDYLASHRQTTRPAFQQQDHSFSESVASEATMELALS